MSTYQELKGLKVKYLAANPSPASKGNVWYDSATFQLKGFVGKAAWSSSADMLVGRYNQGGAGTQTAAFVAGGAVSPDAVTDETYEYNGSGWTTGGTMAGDDRLTTACGTLTAGLAASGWDETANTADSEEYDGTSWAEGSNVNSARRYGGQFGIQTSAVLVAGYVTASNDATEEYNGTSWTAGEDCNTAVEHIGAAGTLTAGLKNGGVNPGGASNATEEYDGTDWTSGNNLNTARRADATFGTQTAAIAAGGYTTTAVASVEAYDGTTWTEIADLAAATNYGNGVGTISAGMHTNGNPSYKTATEEYNNTFEVVTAATWSSGGDLNDGLFGRNFSAGGTQNAGWIHGGYAPYSNSTEEYNGSAWANAEDSSQVRYFGAGGGTLTAGFSCGGYTPSVTDKTEEYDGTDWSSGGDMNSPAGNRMAGGTLTAGIACNGTGPIQTTEYYDGSSWTAQTGTLNSGHRERNGCGTQSSFIAMGGANPGETAMQDEVEEWNGTAWTEVADMVTAVKSGQIMGHAADGAVFNSGLLQPGTAINTTQIFDGTNVVTGPSSTLAQASGNQGCGTAAAGFLAARYNPTAATEEWNGETTAETPSTIDFD